MKVLLWLIALGLVVVIVILVIKIMTKKSHNNPPISSCKNDTDCPGQYCENGNCVCNITKGCSDLCACPSGNKCVDNICTLIPSCKCDSDCEDGICSSGVCISGAKPTHCSCNADCQQIIASSECNPETNTCYVPSGECQNDTDCGAPKSGLVCRVDPDDPNIKLCICINCNGTLCKNICKSPQVCHPDGTCECSPDCKNKKCGDFDGCGGYCSDGSCPTGQECKSGVCSNIPQIYSISGESFLGVTSPFILLPGDSFTSINKSVSLDMQTDHNLCTHRTPPADECANTTASPSFSLFDTDGSFGVYSGTPLNKGQLLWTPHSSTSFLPQSFLAATDNGSIYIFKGTPDKFNWVISSCILSDISCPI